MRNRLFTSNEFIYLTNVPENEYFHSRWGSLIRCEVTKVWQGRFVTNPFHFGGELCTTLSLTECLISFYLHLPSCRPRAWCFWKRNNRKILNERRFYGSFLHSKTSFSWLTLTVNLNLNQERTQISWRHIQLDFKPFFNWSLFLFFNILKYK